MKTTLHNKETQGTFTIKINVSEKKFMEYILNLHHSGYDVSLMFIFYALAKRMHIDDFTYYMKLLEAKS